MKTLHEPFGTPIPMHHISNDGGTAPGGQNMYMFFFGFPYLGVLLCLSAIVVSAIGLKRHQPGAAKSEKVLAILGLVLGIVYTLMAFLWISTGRI